MRQIGTLADEGQARKLADYLLTKDITTRLDPFPSGWIVWVHREEKVDQAKQEFEGFVQNPDDPKYLGVERTARSKRKEAQRIEREHERKSVYLRGQWGYRAPDKAAVTLSMMALSVGMTLATNFGSGSELLNDLLITTFEPISIEQRVLDEDGRPTVHRQVRETSTGLEAVKRGEVWRLVTPIFVHFGLWHILFNMMWLYDLGGLIELRKGHLKFLGLVLLAAIGSNLVEYAWDVFKFGPDDLPYVGGMSGVVYALFGYVWMKSRYEPDRGMYLRPNTVTIMMVWLVICMTGVVGDIANAAHLAGLIIGVVVGFLPHALRELGR